MRIEWRALWAKRRQLRRLFPARPESVPAVAATQADPDRVRIERLRRDLADALAAHELQIVYQPKLRLRTGAIDGVEALARWNHRAFGPISPGVFVPLAEQDGHIRAVTRYVLDRAVADQRRLARAGWIMPFSINLSGMVLTDDIFTREVCAVAAQADGPIGLEITETALIGDPEAAIRNMARYAEAGIAVAIDDYGSGLSSLAYLKQLPARELKIDKLFISSLTTSHRDPLIVRSTIDLAHALEMEVVAEGVESPACLALLRVMGCDVAQGFLISAGLPIDELQQFLANHKAGAVSEFSATVSPPASFWSRS